jgi:hypothetical protein
MSGKKKPEPRPKPRTWWVVLRDWCRVHARGYTPEHGRQLIIAVISGVVGGGVGVWLERQPPPPSEPRALIQLEAELASISPRNEKVVTRYLALFSDDAAVADVRGGQAWLGKNQIADRFRTLPQFEVLNHSVVGDLVSNADGAEAMAWTTTTFRRAGDHQGTVGEQEMWRFQKRNGTWQIVNFQYNLTPR